MPLIGNGVRCPACHAKAVSGEDTLNVPRGAASIWHGLLMWSLFAELLAVGGILLILAMRACT